MKRLAACLLLVALAGCAAPVADDGTDGGLGEVDNVSAHETITITPENGLTEVELDRLTRRTMARIELLRGLDYDEAVDVEVISRAEFRNQSGITVSGGGTGAERNVFWEALFVVGEDRPAGTAVSEASGTSIAGYYSTASREIVIVSDAQRPSVRMPTLVHELLHALQHQQFGLDSSAITYDERQGYLGAIEGEAVHVTRAYAARCDVEWTCLDLTTATAPDDRPDPGINRVVVQPYVSGPEFVATIRQRSGWAGVDSLHDRYPNSSSQVIHPDRYPDDGPVNVSHVDRSGENWETVTRSGKGETLGEGAIFAMLAHNDAITVDGRQSYEHPFTSGWAGDRLVPYESGNGTLGYVWTTEWQTDKDASQFSHAYRELLDNYDAIERGEGVFSIPDGPFADAFRVTRDGTTVRIVNAPGVADLSDVHPEQ